MRFPFIVGLKLYSTNTDLISEAVKLWQKNTFQYIELYIVPGSYLSTNEIWKSCRIPFILHAAHTYDGINLACRNQWEQNRLHFYEVQKFADNLYAETIIIHGGMNGTIDETIYQAKCLRDPRLVLENKPKIAIKGEACVGSSPEEFWRIKISGVLKGFVLDFGHAECAAISLSIEPFDMIKKFLAFSPAIFHISDGLSKSERDTHLNFGIGDRKLSYFVRFIPPGAYVTIETPRLFSKGLADFIKDIEYLESFFHN